MIKLKNLLKESVNESNTVLGKSGNYAVTQYGEPGGIILTKNGERVAIGSYDSDAQTFWFTDLPNENSDKGFDEVKDILKYATKKKLTFVGESVVNEGSSDIADYQIGLKKVTRDDALEHMYGVDRPGKKWKQGMSVSTTAELKKLVKKYGNDNVVIHGKQNNGKPLVDILEGALAVNEAKIAFLNDKLIGDRIQKSGLLPLLGDNNSNLNKSKNAFINDLKKSLISLYKKHGTLPIK